MKIYIVEDDRDIREMEKYALQNSGFDVMEFPESESFYKAVSEEIPDLILLDIMLPGEDGLSILKRLRSESQTKDIPILLATAKTTELDKVKGLDMGADDYISKPFGILELVSRVKALLRRTAPREDADTGVLSYGPISLDDMRHSVTVDGQACELTYKEYELLKFLMANIDIVLTREKLMNKVWGFDYEGESRTVDMHIKTLRHKLGEHGSLIKTIRNVGYRMGR